MKKDNAVGHRLDEITCLLEKLRERINYIDKNEELSKIMTAMGKQNPSILLVQAIEEFYQSLVNYNARAHEVRQLSNKYIYRIFQVLMVLKKEIINHGVNYAAFKVSDINDDVVGWFYEGLEKLNLANPTFNDKRGIINTFEIWLINKGYLRTRYFIKIRKRRVVYDPKCITKIEFDALIQVINQEPHRYRNLENVKYRDHYQPWLAKGLQFALEVGGRMEDIMNLKYSDIKEENGMPVFIKIEDSKYNKRWNLHTQKSKKYRSLPISKNLLKILTQSGYSKMRGTEEFIFLTDTTAPHLRNYIIPNILKAGFSYYYVKLNTGRHLTFKSLRKADVTNKYLITNGHPQYLSGHSSRSVAVNHYVSKEELAKYHTRMGYSVFYEDEITPNEIEGFNISQRRSSSHAKKYKSIIKLESKEAIVQSNLIKYSNNGKAVFSVKSDCFGIIQGEHPFIFLKP